jgi:gliding motility-associated-like protein
MWLSSNAQLTQTVKGGENTQVINFSGGCVYNWVNDNPAIGLAASGTGNIPSFKAVNDGNGPVTAIIKAIPVNLGMAYVPSFKTKDVSVIDIAAQKLVTTIPLNDQPYGACVSHDGKFVYVVDGGEVSVISTETNSVVGIIKTNSYCYDAVISPDDTKLYVTDTNYDQVSVYNTATYELIASIPCGDFPLGLCISPDGTRLYVADANVTNVPNGDAVTVINTVTNSFVAKIEVGYDQESWGITISPDGKRVYTGGRQSVSVINAETNQLVTKISGAFENVFGVVVTPDGSKLYISDENSRLTIINTATNKTAGTVPLPSRATGLALTPDGSGIGAEAGGKLFTISIATNQVISTAKSGSNPNALANFISTGLTCQPVTYTITVNSSKGPSITTAGNLASLSTIYGTPSASENFTLSGSNMKGAVLITPPAGVEISADNVNFSNVLTVGAAGTITATIIYVRLSATAPARTYNGNIVLTSDEATTVNVSLPNSVVSPAPLTVIANNKSKDYGSLIEGAAGSTAFTFTGLQNSETAASVTIIYGAGAAANAAAGFYPGSVQASVLTGGTFNPDNYTITYVAGDITINKIPLTITADDKTKAYKSSNPILTVSYTGFVNNEGPAQFTTPPVIVTDADENTLPGKYPIRVNGAETPDYEISYVQGTLTITALHLYGKIPNTFTPNGDGINDRWDIDDLTAFPGCSVEIFTRYGAVVYRSIGYGTPWQGKFNGADLATGTYYYVIDLKNGDKPYSGSVTILR